MNNQELEPEWKGIVEEFTDICREFEHMVDLEMEIENKKAIFDRAIKFAEDFERIREEKSRTIFQKSNNLYNAQNHYESLPSIEPSITHLIEEIDKEGHGKFLKYIDDVLDNKTKYLSIYFGIRYEGMWSPKQLYQVHQLLLILFRCTKKYSREILSSMAEASFMRFRNEFGNSYREPMLFIRRELLKGLSFKDALVIEYFVGTYRYFISTFFQVLTERVVKVIPFMTPKIETEILDDLSTMVLMKLKKLNKIEYPAFREPDDLFWRAYLHFVFLSVEDIIKEPYLNTFNFLHNRKPIPPLFWIKPDLIKNNTIVWIAKNPGQKAGKNMVNVQFDNTIYSVEDFVSGNAELIAKHWGGKMNERLIKQHSKDYCKLAKLLVLYNMRSLSEPISLVELMNVIDLFEENQQQLIKAPKKYNVKGTTRNEKTFKRLLRDINDDVSQDFILRDEEPNWHAIEGFLNTLNYRLANTSEETVKKQNEIRREIFAYLKSVVPILAEEPHGYKNITEIAESIINTDTLNDYVKWKTHKVIMQLERYEEISTSLAQIQMHKD